MTKNIMTKRNITVVSLSAFLILAISSFAFAYGNGNGRGCGGNGPGSGYSQLTPEKQVAVQAIFDKHQAQTDELRNAWLTKHATLESLVNSGKGDEKKIGKLVNEMSEIRTNMQTLRDTISSEVEKATGIVMNRGYGNCLRGNGGYGSGNCPGYGSGRGSGRGMGNGYNVQ